MAVNINNQFNQYNNIQQGQVAPGKLPVTSEQPLNSGIQMLKDMLAGDVFSGKVMSSSEGSVLLALNNGKSLLAHLSDNASVQVGQNITFMVEDNNGANISIRTLPVEQQQALIITKALDAAQFPVTDTNVSIVNELLKLNMPINADTISQMVKHANRFPEANINTIANLVKLEIPVTENNIAQFEAYKSYEHSITGELNHLVEGFTALLTADAGDSSLISQSAATFGDIVDMLYTNDNGQTAGEVFSNTLTHTLGKENLESLVAQFKNLADSAIAEGYIPEKFTALLDRLGDNNTTVKDLLKDLSNMLKDSPELSSKLKEVVDSEDFGKLIKQMIDETMKLNPQDVSKDEGIKKYYKRMSDITEAVSDALNGNEAGKQLSADMDSVKSNIDFMNDLNKNMTYFQMPIKLQQGDANGELYVFTNKKALKAGSDQVSALLHLDMDNLGPVDVYVKLAGINVSTNFCLESEEMLDFVYSHIDKLNARLEQLGYNCHFEMKVAENTNDGEPAFDFVKDFIEKDSAGVSTTQYILDVKA